MGIIAERWLINECVHLSVHRATGLRTLTGLIGRAELRPGTALRLARCRSVHGVGMGHELDVVFLGGDGAITSIRRLAPGRLATDRAAADAFELRAGEAARLGLVAGARLTQLNKGES
jgi:uncharacterized membrane protein (UPF0127 family)